MELAPLPTLTNEQQEDRVAHHDIAQRLMSKKLGFETGQLFVGTRFGQPSSLSKNRSKASTKLDSSAAIADHLRKRIMVLCAGVISEVQWFEKLLGFELPQAHVTSICVNGITDGARLTDHDKLQELLIILCGIERVPSENDDFLEDQKHEIFIEIYQETLNIFNELSEKIFILTNLAVNENWSNGRLIVTDERLVDLEAEADALSSKKPIDA
ncbi:hypothetical protein HFV04_003380 [Pseudomonas sp. BIGb0427]|uniref:hypothetical protein n=1 Tax=Pseudomonas sp. BIGb0427 TaxID=2724470 RepID=UPI0018A6E5F6|nr:hypothetical protein [Pseudomonas sp. BIGb0427]QPG63828.1 hypothetical protein HFV04_003380 [Pseudomonas sp. BIGb0427]